MSADTRPVQARTRPPLRAWLLGAGCAMAVAGLGGAATDLGPWYRSLVQPAWKPPDWAFGPAWTLIFSLCAWAGVRAWWASPTTAARQRLLLAFGLNGALNLLWSVLFFLARRPDWALFELLLLAASVAYLVRLCAGVDRAASGALLPYLAWVIFAGSVNAGVWWLNPGAIGASP